MCSELRIQRKGKLPLFWRAKASPLPPGSEQHCPAHLVSAGGVHLHRQDWDPDGEQHGVQGVLHRGPRLRAACHLQRAGPSQRCRNRHDRLFPGRQREGRGPSPSRCFPLRGRHGHTVPVHKTTWCHLLFWDPRKT